MKNSESTTTISAEELDRKFDDGEDVSQYFDWENGKRSGLEIKRVNVDLPNHYGHPGMKHHRDRGSIAW